MFIEVGDPAGGILNTIGGIVGATIPIIGPIVDAILGSGNALKQFAHDVGLAVKLIWQALSQSLMAVILLVRDGVLGLLRRLKDLIDDIRRKLGPILGAVIEHAKAIRDLIDNIFKRFIAPILQTIQHIRQVLTIFKVFHLKFAQVLDAKLAQVESDIATRFLKVKQTINQMLDWMELIADPSGILKTSAIWNGLAQSITALRGLILGFGFTNTNPVIARPTQQQLYQDASSSWTNTFQRWTTGNLTPEEQQWSDGLRGLFS